MKATLKLLGECQPPDVSFCSKLCPEVTQSFAKLANKRGRKITQNTRAEMEKACCSKVKTKRREPGLFVFFERSQSCRRNVFRIGHIFKTQNGGVQRGSALKVLPQATSRGAVHDLAARLPLRRSVSGV